jgi:hypothetical protein
MSGQATAAPPERNNNILLVSASTCFRPENPSCAQYSPCHPMTRAPITGLSQSGENIRRLIRTAQWLFSRHSPHKRGPIFPGACARMWVRIPLTAAMVVGVAIGAQAQRNTDVPSGSGVWPPVKSPAPQTGSAPATKDASSPKDAGDMKGERPAGDMTGGTSNNGFRSRQVTPMELRAARTSFRTD